MLNRKAEAGLKAFPHRAGPRVAERRILAGVDALEVVIGLPFREPKRSGDDLIRNEYGYVRGREFKHRAQNSPLNAQRNAGTALTVPASRTFSLLSYAS